MNLYFGRFYRHNYVEPDSHFKVVAPTAADAVVIFNTALSGEYRNGVLMEVICFKEGVGHEPFNPGHPVFISKQHFDTGY